MTRRGNLPDKACRPVPRERLSIAPCQEACPAGIDVPRYIRYIKLGKYEEALAVNRERMPFPEICAYACFNPCEIKCAMQQLGEPVAIRALKRIAAERGGDFWRRKKKFLESTGKRVAIVGAGPSGLTAAYYIASRGHQVTIFDARSEAGGTMRYGIPRYRLPKEVLEKSIRELLDLGVLFKARQILGKDIFIDDLTKDYDAVLIALGATKSKKMNIPGISWQGVKWGLEFLQDLGSGKKIKIKEKVLTVGGGNVAIDVALTAKRLGARQVDIVCLEQRDEMAAHEWEIARAEEEGVTIHNGWGPVRIVGKNEQMKQVEFKKCIEVFDQEGRFAPRYDENTTMAIDANQAIFAIGQESDNGISSELDVKENFLTSKAGVFAAGDFVTGASSIINSIVQGRNAAVAMDKFLGGNGDISEILATAEEEVSIPDIREIIKPRQPVPLLSLRKRTEDFRPVELGYAPKMAFLEANRCLNCDARSFQVTLYRDNCKACGYCAEVCPRLVFEPAGEFNKKGLLPMEVHKAERCIGCLQCFYVCPDFAIDIRELHTVKQGAN